MVLITGITGKTGRWFLKKLIDQNISQNSQSYRAIVRATSNVELINDSGLSIEKIYGDLDDESFLDDALKNMTTVFHIAGIQKSLKVVQAAVKNKVKWIILVHTTGIYSKYKAAGEEYRQIEEKIYELVKDSGIALTILRPTMIYGSVNDRNVIVFIKMVDKLRIFPVVSHGNYPLQPVHEKDVGNAYFQVLANEKVTKGKNYILSGKDPILLIDMFKTIGRLLHKKNVFISIPYPIAYLGAVILYFVSLGKVDYREKVQRLVEPRIFPHDDASRDFGFSPVSFEEGIVSEIDEYLRNLVACMKQR